VIYSFSHKKHFNMLVSHTGDSS